MSVLSTPQCLAEQQLAEEGPHGAAVQSRDEENWPYSLNGTGSTCVRPALKYASPVWHGSLTESHALAFQRVQAIAARRILRVLWDTPKR